MSLFLATGKTNLAELVTESHLAAEKAMKEGEIALKAKAWSQAADKFQAAVNMLVGNKTKVPMDTRDDGGFYRRIYIDMYPFKRLAMQSCCRGMGTALARMKKYEEVRV